MSVLSFPRIYFKGYMSWDPCTFNNNDFSIFPTYDPANAALNWTFLAGQGITPANFTSAFRPWAITLQDDCTDSPSGPRIPAEWNMFGSHAVSCVQYGDYTTTITGGALGYNKPVTADPLIGQPVSITGDGGRGGGRLVDTNPASPWSSQIYFGQLGFGSGANSFSGTRYLRMHSRWLNPSRIYNSASMLTAPASRIGVCFQTCIPNDQMTWPAASASPLITALQQAALKPGALGIMVRFTAYVNLYYMNGIFNNTKQQPRNYEDLAKLLQTAWDAWNAGQTNPSPFFSNPCYSHVVGTAGVWSEGELVSVPGGRCLAADQPVAPLEPADAKSGAVHQAVRFSGHELKTTTQAPRVPLGPVAVNVDCEAGFLSLDFGGTMPELGIPGPMRSSLVKADFGPLTIGVVAPDSSFTSIATIDYAQYQQSAYEASAGIIDIPLPSAATQLLADGALAIQAQQGATVLLEQPYTAETDTRGIYLDQNGQTEFSVMVCKRGVPSPGATVLIAQYDSGLNLLPSNIQPLVAFTTGAQTTLTASGITTNVTVVTTDETGNATVGISAQSPGFPVLAFLPFSGGTPPQPPASFNFTDNAFYTTVRVLPFDDAVPLAFVELWNSTQDQAQAWSFIYFRILYLYDMLFNVMLPIVNLGSQQAVEANISAIWSLISSAAAAESTFAMPITRDMSAGKRRALQLWIYLAANNYAVQDLCVNSIPAGWTPNKKVE